MKKAPKKLSAAIRMALKDLALVEKDKRYRVEMDTWHVPGQDGCSVCFAGSVMAKSLGVKHYENKHWFGFDAPWPTIFIALNRVRFGSVGPAVRIFYGRKDDGGKVREEYYVVEYDADPKLFRRQMFRIARDLEGVKL